MKQRNTLRSPHAGHEVAVLSHLDVSEQVGKVGERLCRGEPLQLAGAARLREGLVAEGKRLAIVPGQTKTQTFRNSNKKFPESCKAILLRVCASKSTLLERRD